MSFIDALSVAAAVGNCWFHHQEFFRYYLGMREKYQRPVLKSDIEYRPPEKWEENLKNSLNTIWEKYKDKKPITLQSGQQYKGETKKVKGTVIPHGKGILGVPGDYLYVGNFENGIENGEGQALRSDTSKRLGTFKNGALTGLALISMGEGDTYIGNFKEDQPIGKGKLLLKNGSFCNVDIEESKSMAECYEKNNEMYYKGDFTDFKCSGKGTFYFDNGESYEGDLVEGNIEGYGKRFDKYGDELYRGNFANNQYKGYFQERETIGYLTIGFVNLLLHALTRK